MKIILLTDFFAHPEGTVLNLDPYYAKEMIESGHAMDAEENNDNGKDSKTDPKDQGRKENLPVEGTEIKEQGDEEEE